METVRSIYDKKIAAGLRRDPAQERVGRRLDELGSQLRESVSPALRLKVLKKTARGLYLWGDVGRGKSMLVSALVDAYDDIKARRTHFHMLMRDVHQALHQAQNAGQSDPIHVAAEQVTKGLVLLVLDELEITDVVDAMIVGRLFERIIEQGITIVVTSNSPPSELYQHGLRRDVFAPFVRLIEEHMDLVHLDGETDYRRDSHTSFTHYLTSSKGDVAEHLDTLWNRLPVQAEESFNVTKHLTLRRKGQVVRGSFDALCRGPRSASDYLELVQSVDAVLVEDVPRIAVRDHDAARRFILLIDTLYDAGCGLAISSESWPEDLYVDGEVAREFRRTVSRLYEMGRDDWPGNAVFR